MAAIVQSRVFTSTNGFGTTHDLTFANPVTSGNTLIALLFGAEDVSDITGGGVLGMTGTPAADQDYTATLAVRTARVYRYTNADSSATGFRFTMSAPHTDLIGRVIEVSGAASSSPFTAGGTFPADFEPTELDATASVNAAGDFAFGHFADVTLANITSTRSGFTQSADSAGTGLYQDNMNTGSGSVTAGATLSSNSGFLTEGFVVTYKAASSLSLAQSGQTSVAGTVAVSGDIQIVRDFEVEAPLEITSLAGMLSVGGDIQISISSTPASVGAMRNRRRRRAR